MEQENSAQPHILRELAPVFGAESLPGSDPSGANSSSRSAATLAFDTNCTTTLRGKDSGGVKRAASATIDDEEDAQQSQTAPYQAPPRQIRAPRQTSVIPTVVPTEFGGAENSDLPASGAAASAAASAAWARLGGKATTTSHKNINNTHGRAHSPPSSCLLYTSPSPRDKRQSRMPSSA